MTKIRSTRSSNVQDRRGQGGGGGLGGLGGMGGGGLNFPIKAGGGILGIIVLLATMFLPKLLGGLGGTSTAAEVAPETADGETACVTEIEQIMCGAADDVQEYWANQFPITFGSQYEATDTIFFSGFTNTGCGQASSEVGPFYCPADKLVYFDLDFLQQLQQQFGATGDLAAQYIAAHEYGHHVQNLLGINAQMHQAQQNDPSRANEYSVALELQADCLAGAWARSAADQGELDNAQEIQEALNAAAAVGDDRIQQQTQGRVDPESWTHGSSQQRMDWFSRGFDTADPGRCTTFEELL